MNTEQLNTGKDLNAKIKNLNDATEAIKMHIDNNCNIRYAKIEFQVLRPLNANYVEDTFSTNMTQVTPEMQEAIKTEFSFFASRIKHIYDKQIKIFQTEFDNL